VIWPPRPAAEAELDATARLWHDAWQDAHAAHVPAALVRARTLADFRRRLGLMGDRLRIAGPPGQPLGLCAIDGDELYQLFVAAGARGTGLGASLLADGEARLAASGIAEARLDCLDANTAAAAFYTRMGWRDAGLIPRMLATPDGDFEVSCIDFRKRLVAVC
jgi:ribosomal protein S18 acetylase RimI-like enzyme